MNGNAIRLFYYTTKRGIRGITVSAVFFMLCASAASAGEGLQKCSISGSAPVGTVQERTSDGPTCGIEITCTDRPLQLGYSDGVCFRATCPGIWALIHKRVDQASFRRRFITYRHYAFRGYWELKDQGVIESGQIPLRELFLVLPDDLIEFKLRDPDCNTAVEVRNLGYIKKGSPEELKHWLAYNVYMERPEKTVSAAGGQNGLLPGSCPNGLDRLASGLLLRVLSLGRSIGLPTCP
ncbi:MAG: hypothetical protein ACLQPD_36995 [Desulfomonilaceae bacterium]